MKKFFLSLVAAIVAASATFAQNTFVVTLSHGETVTMFYGSYALRDAVNAAQSGDVINLSGGAFQAVDISKAITLRGTGIDDVTPTYISGDFSIDVPSDDANRLSFEGIRCSGKITMKGTFNNPYFVKSQIYRFSYANNAAIKNAMIANCKITGDFSLHGTSTVQFINSYVSGFDNQSSNAASSFVNCVILPYDRYWANYMTYCQLMNCIIYQNGSNSNLDPYYNLPSSTIATNCVSIGFRDFYVRQAANTGNKAVGYDEFAKVFKNFTGEYTESQTFELADDAKTTYLGTDGSQVGLYGGVLPYDSKPFYPQITKMNVASKTTADGKLSVEIEVSATE